MGLAVIVKVIEVFLVLNWMSAGVSKIIGLDWKQYPGECA
jgi:hypothetical protein